MKKGRPALTGVFESAKPKATQATGGTDRPDRQGRAAVPFWTTITAKRQLRLLAANRDTTQQALLTEALNDLFRKYHQPPVA